MFYFFNLQAKITDKLAEHGSLYDNESLLTVRNLAEGLDGKMIPIPQLTDAENNHLELALSRLNKICEVCQMLDWSHCLYPIQGVSLDTLC